MMRSPGGTSLEKRKVVLEKEVNVQLLVVPSPTKAKMQGRVWGIGKSLGRD